MKSTPNRAAKFSLGSKLFVLYFSAPQRDKVLGSQWLLAVTKKPFVIYQIQVDIDNIEQTKRNTSEQYSVKYYNYAIRGILVCGDK